MKYYIIQILSVLWLLSMSICTISAQKPYQPGIDDPITESWRWTYISELHGKSIRCISQSQDGDMLFGITNGVMKYNGYNWELLSPSDSTMELSITTLCDGEDGTIYVGTTTGLYSIKDREWEKLFPISDQLEVWVSDVIRLPGGSILASFGDSRNEETISGLFDSIRMPQHYIQHNTPIMKI